jgi:UDP-N-acetylmuramate dehydrogenase
VLLYLPECSLQKYNTLAVSAKAKLLVRVQDQDQLSEALAFAKKEELPVLILGGGSNIVLRNDFLGLAIQIAMRGIEIIKQNHDCVWLKVAAGENWHELVEYTLVHGFYGLENLSLIPGSVGAAPIQNIGAYGVEVKDSIEELTAVNIESRLAITFIKNDCQFAYRESIFKNQFKDQYVITSVTFCLSKKPTVNISYPALRHFFADKSRDQITPHDVSEAVIQIRQSKLPDPSVIPNVGSFFKNPIISAEESASLLQRFPQMVQYSLDDGRVKLAAAWMIDQLGWRGKFSSSGVRVHSEQALVLINPEKKTGAQVLQFAYLIQDSVLQEFGVALEIEPCVYP